MPAQLAVLPAVDLVGGRELRLTGNGGDNGDGDPLAVALGWQRDGASWIHLASGGIAGLADLRALLTLACPAPGAPGVEGVIVGKALYAGQFTLREALAAVTG